MAKSEKTQTLHAPAGTQKSTELFDTIAWLRAFLSAGVVAIHVHYFDSAQIGAKNFYDFYRLFTNVCVPAFFFISGCLFFRGNAFSTAIYIDKLKKRSRSLLLPYILFNYFAMAVWAILIFGFGLHTNKPSFEGMTVFDYLGITKSYATLWFVNNLIILAIISPLIYWAIKKMGIMFLILAGTYLVSPKPFGGLEFLGGVGIFWFSLGAFVSLNKIDFIHAIKNLNKWILLLIWALFTTFYFIYPNEILAGRTIGIAIGIVVCFTWANYLSNHFGVPAWVKYLAGASMFIYCVHDLIPKLFFDVIFKYLYANFLPHNSLSAGTIIVLEFICMYLSSLAIYAVLKKAFPRVCAILCGGR